MTTLEEALKSGLGRLEGKTAWVTWDAVTQEWVVRQQGYRQKVALCLYAGIDLPTALAAFEGAERG